MGEFNRQRERLQVHCGGREEEGRGEVWRPVWGTCSRSQVLICLVVRLSWRSHRRSCLVKLSQRHKWHKYQWDSTGRRDEIRSSMRINMANKSPCRNMLQNCKLKHWKAQLFVTQHLGGKGHPSVVCSRPIWG